MTRRILGLAVYALSSLALCWEGAERLMAAPILINGSFENTGGTFVPDGNDTMDLAPGSTAIPGWTVITNRVAWIGPTNPFGIVASDGGFSLDLQGYSDGFPYGGVTQILATNAAHNYQLQFDIGTAGNGTTTSVTASAGTASALFSAINTDPAGQQQWTPETLNFVASGATTVSLLGTAAGHGGDYIGLDHVVLNDLGPVIPEPATLTLVGIGIVGMAGYGCRRKK